MKTLKLTGKKIVIPIVKGECQTLEQRVLAAQGEPQGEEWDFDVSRLQQRILDGSVWSFEGSVGRAANDALESGACFLPSAWLDGVERKPLSEVAAEDLVYLKKPVRDAYGNKIPYRQLLKPGSKGTLENSARFYDLD